MTTISRKRNLLKAFVTAVTIAAIAVALFPATAWADQGINVTNNLLQEDVSAGDVFTHTMIVSANPSGSALNIIAEARGFGQGPDGSYIPLAADDDLSSQSARGFITDITPSSFSLAPGESRQVTATITVPEDLEEVTRYAVIHIHTSEVGTSPDSAVKLAAIVPIVLTPAGAVPVEQGAIADLTIDEVQTGQPLQIHTSFKNTGNHHFKAYNEITVTNAAGKEIAYTFSPLTSPVIPPFSHRFDISVTPWEELSAGTYHIKSEVFHEDGTLLDSEETDFELTIPWEIFPPQIVKDSLETFTFDNEEPSEIDATEKSNIRISISGSGKVTGEVLTARYDEPPQVSVPFSTAGAEGVLYSAIHTSGFNQGKAQVSFLYTESEISDFDENSLFLAYWDGGKWENLENIQVFSGANYVTGEVPVNDLVGAPVVLGGQLSDTTEGQVAELPGDTGDTAALSGLWIALAALGAVIIIALVILVFAYRNRRR